MKNSIADLKIIAREIRREILDLVTRSESSHLGCAFSIVELLAVLYYETFDIGKIKRLRPDRDRFVLSKGHACVALYVVLCKLGFFKRSVLETYYQDNGILPGHPVLGSVPGIEASTGSLGHGLSLAVGMALAAKMSKKDHRVFAIIGDGECNEGTIWEAALFAAQHQLDNLTVILDRNGFQGFGRTEEVLELEPLHRKWESFNWQVQQIDGHDLRQIYTAVNRRSRRQPNLIIAHTRHGKGIAFMENSLAWHYRSPRGQEYARASEELKIK